MPIQLQEHNIREVLKLKGIDSDLIDVKSLLDSTLDYSQNYKLIMEYINEDIHKQGKKEEKALTALSGEYSQAEGMKTNTSLSELFKKHRVIGLIGERDSAKTSLMLYSLIELRKELNAKKQYTKIYVHGIEPKLYPYLAKYKIEPLYSINDLLQMNVKDSILAVDEAGAFISPSHHSKQEQKIIRWFSRIAHLNNYVILSTSQTDFWNKLMASLVSCFLVKRIRFDNLTNNTYVKNVVKVLETSSDFFLDIEQADYFIISNEMTKKCTFPYDINTDTKRLNKKLF